MSEPRLEYLLTRYLDKNHTNEEYEELMRLVGDASYDEAIKNRMDKVWTGLLVDRKLTPEKMGLIFANVLKGGEEPQQGTSSAEFVQSSAELSKAGNAKTEGKIWMMRLRRIYRIVAAAAIGGLIAGGIYLFSQQLPSLKPAGAGSTGIILANDIAPGGNKAVLTLADGRQIVLDSASGTNIPVQGETRIIKLNEGVLTYNENSQIANPAFSGYNTISTPRGGQYQVILPDGSTVWLNSLSSLKFPVAFADNLREAELKGEAYFEIVEDKKRPFRVKVGDARIAVLGTGFNIMAYSDEAEIRTTLVNGAVKVLTGSGEALLKPGDQAHWGQEAMNIQVAKGVNIAEVLAWKNGVFQFNNATIQSIMRQAARWYDIEVEYKGTTTELFNGSLPRSVSAATLFKVFETTGLIKFDINGKKVTVNL